MNKTLKCPNCGTVVCDFDVELTDIKLKVAEKAIYEMSKVCGFSPLDIIGRSRKQDIATARHLIVLVCRETFDMSVEALGTILERDHATNLHSTGVAGSLLKYKDELALLYFNKIKEYYNN